MAESNASTRRMAVIVVDLETQNEDELTGCELATVLSAVIGDIGKVHDLTVWEQAEGESLSDVVNTVLKDTIHAEAMCKKLDEICGSFLGDIVYHGRIEGNNFHTFKAFDHRKEKNVFVRVYPNRIDCDYGLSGEQTVAYLTQADAEVFFKSENTTGGNEG